MTPLAPGDQLDQYQIESLVASSGMASVFRATDTLSGRAVAIKVPHPEAECDPVFYDRFQREIEVGKKLDHPGIAKVFDRGGKRLYMAMEWVEGRLLRQVLSQEGKLPVERAAGIARKICEALDHIHANGVVHRDLKPENIVLDEADHIKIIDFGIAGHAGSRRLTFGKLTQTMGSPDYISPEQVRGKRGDARSDLYALGVILYEMLTGQVPFQGPNLFAIMNDRLVNHPTPPRELNPAISPELQEVVYRALEREPGQRYATAREFAKDLSHLDQVGVAERIELREWKNRRVPKKHAVLSYLMLALIPVVIFGLLLFVARRG